jgi:hypothetical protein
MPRGTSGERRPAYVIGCALTVARLSIGDMEEKLPQPSGKVRRGLAGAKERAENLTPEQRQEIARKAAGARWG